jgi:protein-disulfide isomerase
MGITPEQVKAQVTSLLGPTDFDAAYARLLPAIRQDTADARALSVNSTPTYFVNGVRAQTPQGWLGPQLFELALKIELEKADIR